MEAKDEHGFIPGIFNYCDRWCERCPFSSRCHVYAIEMGIAVQGLEAELDDVAADFGPEPGEEDPDIDDPSGEEGDEPSEAEIEEEMLQRDAARLLADAHPLAEGAKTLASLAGQILEASRDRAMASGEDILAFRDALDVLAHYQFFIAAKVHRALMGRQESAAAAEETEPFQEDADGSAKIAHITCAAARDAARRAGAFDPALAPLAAAYAQTADQVLNLIDHTFPAHRAFHRPGFDDPPQDAGRA